MSKYLKQFNIHTQYEYYINGSDAILPNVSICTTEGDVHYNPYIAPIVQQHEYVEIGGVKWATMNVGATSITDYGLYFQWGDTQGYTAEQVTGSATPHKAFSWADYKYSNNGGSTAADMTKYNSTDNLKTLEASDDAVTAAWGGSWRMPTEADFNTLTAATTNAWVTDYQGSGINGRLFTDKNDSSKVLFFPAAGNCYDGSARNVGSYGYCWSSSLYTRNVVIGRYLVFSSGSCRINSDNRRVGYPVRGVLDDSNS